MDERAGETRRHLLDLFFLLGVALKAVDGLAELVGGAVLLFVGPAGLSALVGRLTAHALTRDPHDFVANLLVNGTSHLPTSTVQITAVFLIVHGIVKVGIVVAMLFGAVRAYPWAIAALAALTVLQVVQLAMHPSVGLVLFAVLDVAVILLTWREWRQQHGLRETFAETIGWIRRRDRRTTAQPAA